MNDPKHFLLGWASFAAAGIGGAILGYRRNQSDQLQRNIDDVEDTIARNKRMDAMGAKWEKDHSMHKVPRAIKVHSDETSNVEALKTKSIIDEISWI